MKNQMTDLHAGSSKVGLRLKTSAVVMHQHQWNFKTSHPLCVTACGGVCVGVYVRGGGGLVWNARDAAGAH